MTDASYAFLRPGHYARGWHILLFSQELNVGDVKPLRYFDHDFVIYRGESGRAAVLVPYPFAVDDHQTVNAAYLVDAGIDQVSTAIVVVALVGSVLTSYAKARAELILTRMPGGFLERGERIKGATEEDRDPDAPVRTRGPKFLRDRGPEDPENQLMEATAGEAERDYQ